MAIESDTSPRELGYPLYNSADRLESQPVDGDADIFEWETEDPDEKVIIQLELSLNEYVALASAVDVGRDIAYASDSYLIWWIWVRAKTMVDWCVKVLNCLMTDGDVQAYLNGLIASGVQNAAGYPLTQSQMAQNLSNTTDCDLDELWGSCLYTVQILNRLNEDFLEQMEALTNNQEIVAYVVGAIPILETLPIDEFIGIADKVREFVAEFYAAGYDVDFEQEMACDIFCLARQNSCVLNMDVLIDYFFGRASAVEGFEDAWQTALTIVGAMANWQEMTGEKVVLVMMAANVGFLSFLNSAFGMDFGEFSLKARSGIPDDDWETICDECACEAVLTRYDMTIIPPEMDVDTDGGLFGSSGSRIVNAPYQITINLPETQSVTRVAVTLVKFPVNTAGDTVTINGIDYEFDQPIPLPPNTGYEEWYDFNPPLETDTIFIQLTQQTVVAWVDVTSCVTPAGVCDDCETYTEEDVPVSATFTGGAWVPTDSRISVENAGQWGGTYIAMAAGGGLSDVYFNEPEPKCVNQVKLYISPAASMASPTMTLLIDGTDYPITLPSTFNSPVIVTVDVTPRRVATMVISFTSGASNINLTDIKMSVCEE